MENKAKKVSVKKNYIYNSIYQIFTILIPIITTPYISQILLPDGVGKYSFTYSIVNFFILFAQLGFGYYAQREIAKVQNNKYQQTIVFYEVMIVKSFTVGLSLIIYIIMCINGFFGEYVNLMWWWILLILAQEFDISFLFQGNEDFAKIVLRNIFIKILGIIMIFAFIKGKNDVWIYVLSISLSNFLGSTSTWVYIPQFICKINFKDLHPMHHLRPAIQLFIPTIASVIYSYLDRTLIGTLIDGTYVDIDGVVKSYANLENGFYEQSEKIIKVGTSLITALGAVMLPRNSKEYADGNKDKLKENIYLAFSFVFILGCPIMFGLAAISSNLVPWFLGNGYEKCISYIRMLSPLVILFGIDNVLGIQYLLTTGRDKKYTISVVSGTIANIILNILMIPNWGAKGAIIASLIAEMLIVTMMYFVVIKEISIKKILCNVKKYIFSACIMFISLIVIQQNITYGLTQTLYLIAFGAIIYAICLIVLKDKLFIDFIINIVSKLKIKLNIVNKEK